YCGVESAVRIRTRFVARVRGAARATARTIDEAAALDRRERAETRGVLLRELRRYLLTISAFGGLFAVWAWDDDRVQRLADGSAPGLGIAALVIGTFLLIGLMLRSGAGERAAEEDRQRRGDNGLPGWVRFVGPVGFWVVLWLVRLIVWR